MLRTIIALFLTALLTSCTTQIQKAYHGPALPASQLAILHRDTSDHMHGTKLFMLQLIIPVPIPRHRTVVTDVDDHGVYERQIQIRPGRHRVKVDSILDKGGSIAAGGISFYGVACIGCESEEEMRSFSIEFTATAGREYRIGSYVADHPHHIWVEDITKGEIVAGEKPMSGDKAQPAKTVSDHDTESQPTKAVLVQKPESDDYPDLGKSDTGFGGSETGN